MVEHGRSLGKLGEKWRIKQSYPTHFQCVGAAGPFKHKVSICPRVLPNKRGVEAGESRQGTRRYRTDPKQGAMTLRAGNHRAAGRLFAGLKSRLLRLLAYLLGAFL